jgi:hypothetical protein
MEGKAVTETSPSSQAADEVKALVSEITKKFAKPNKKTAKAA